MMRAGGQNEDDETETDAVLREVAWKGREGQANEGGTGGGERNTTAPEKVNLGWKGLLHINL